MKRIVLILSAGIFLLTSCNQYNNVLKSADYEYKYEAAKEYFVKGQYSRAALLFGDLIAVMKGTVRAQESLYMLAMSEYCDGNYDVASSYFKKYYQSYPKGTYVEYAFGPPRNFTFASTWTWIDHPVSGLRILT